MEERWLSPKEVTELEKVTERAFYNRFKKNHYKTFRYVKSGNGGRGGQKLEIALSSLPPEIRASIIQQKESSYIKATILPARADLSLEEARELLKKFDAAPAWSRYKAEARAEVIKSFVSFTGESPLTPSKNLYINRYNFQNHDLGISADTYRLISKLTRATLDRWRADHKDLGLVGLLVKGNGSRYQSRINPEVRNYILALLSSKPHTRPRRIYEYMQNKFSSIKDILPSEATIRRFIKKWQAQHDDLYTFLKNPDKWRSNFQLALGDAGEKAKYFLHVLEFDSTPADIMCADKHRYTLIGAIDIFSRKAKCIIVPVGKSTAIANLMRWVIINWGLYDVMIADNGKDYASRHIEAVCGAFKIEMPTVPPFTPEAKPHIERFFRTISTMLFEELDGYIGHSVAERKDIESQRSFAQRMFNKGETIECRMMPDELQAVIDNWLEKIYHQRIHSELKKSPEMRAGESSQPVRRIMDPRILDILLAPCGHPTVQKKGIRYKGGWYVAPELGDYVKKKVEIRENLTDAGKLYVFEAESKAFICIATNAALGGLSVEEVNKARKQQTKHIREQARALKTLAKEVGDPMLDLLEAKSKEPGKVFAFHKEEKAEGRNIKEAEKALADPAATFREFQPDPEVLAAVKEETEGSDKVVQLYEEAPIFETRLERYRYLQKQTKIRKLTQREEGFIEGYEASDEYYRIFILPYK